MRVRGGKSVTAVHDSVMGAQTCSGRAQKCVQGHGSATGGQRSVIRSVMKATVRSANCSWSRNCKWGGGHGVVAGNVITK